MLKIIGLICLLRPVVAKDLVDEKNHSQFISQHVKSLASQKLGQGLCEGQTCCNVTSTEACPISSMMKDQSTLVLPGGETRCIYSYSTPFAFQVVPGDSDKLLVYFQGGGACWDEASTKEGYCTTDSRPQSPVGVFNRNNDMNRYKSYTIVHITYCSGDLFGGNVTRDYNDDNGQPIRQTGLANARSAMDWIVAQTKNGGLASTFSDVIIMGCSAGSLGTQLWSKEVLSILQWKQAAVVPDSYAGVFPAGTVGPLVYAYGFCESGFLSPELYAKCAAQTLSIEEINLEFAAAHPTVPVSFLQSKTDTIQQAYYIAIALYSNSSHSGTTPTKFYADTNAVFGLYNAQLPNFLTYLVDGDNHCFTCYDLFFSADAKGPEDAGATTKGVAMSDWVGSMPLAASGATVDTVCEGDVVGGGVQAKGPVDNTYCASAVYPKQFVNA